ncbi:hypothetical protein OESDEN_04944, partial [Oesophagostomum dentatum]
LFEREINIPIKRGVRHGDPISPKLFSRALQYAIKYLGWGDYGIHAEGTNITNLRFADDVVLCAKSHEEAERMLNNLSETSKLIDLEMKMKKTKYMKNVWCLSGEAKLEGRTLEEVTSYTYLGISINMEEDLTEEMEEEDVRHVTDITTTGSLIVPILAPFPEANG